jgi:G3E family GTPase
MENTAMSEATPNLIPATIITGFLGAGKTTLLNRILKDNNHKQKIAVIENEFGEENIDSSILVQDDAEEIVQMSNGCVCCTVRGDLVTALNNLVAKKDAGQIDFDRVIIETTGLANPSPVAHTFFLEDSVADRYMIDGIITLMDGVFGMHQLDEYEEARQQVGFADKILISKVDIADPETVEELAERIRDMNSHAAIHKVDFGKVDIKEVLDLQGFNLNSNLDIDHEEEHDHACTCGHHHDHDETCTCGHHHHEDGEPCTCGHHHDHDGECTCGCGHHHHHHHHLDDIVSFVFRSFRPFDSEKLNFFFDEMISRFGIDMLRYKGVLNVKGTNNKVVFQGVQQLMGSDLVEKWEDGPRESKMVFIGKKLPKEIFIEGLEQCLTD